MPPAWLATLSPPCKPPLLLLHQGLRLPLPHALNDSHACTAGKCKATGVDNVGTVPAALTTYLAIQAFKPDIVISTGAWVGAGAGLLGALVWCKLATLWEAERFV